MNDRDSLLTRYAIRLGDDAMVHGQRLCEWSSNAPTLEEDLALANVALDYLGRARMLYSLAGNLCGQSEDELAFTRDTRAFQNLLILELPRGDFAFTLVRQFLLDEFEHLFFDALTASANEMLAAIAGKTRKEVAYHRRRSQEWLRRFGLGTAESARRAQAALDTLWGYVDEMFAVDDLEATLIAEGIAADRAVLRATWQAAVTHAIEAAALTVPDTTWRIEGGRQGLHTEHLGHLLSEMQFMQRAYPGLSW